jgi:hypothetical protein
MPKRLGFLNLWARFEASPASTASAWALLTSAPTGGPPSAQVTEADFGAEEVRSKLPVDCRC